MNRSKQIDKREEKKTPRTMKHEKRNDIKPRQTHFSMVCIFVRTSGNNNDNNSNDDDDDDDDVGGGGGCTRKKHVQLRKVTRCLHDR